MPFPTLPWASSTQHVRKGPPAGDNTLQEQAGLPRLPGLQRALAGGAGPLTFLSSTTVRRLDGVQCWVSAGRSEEAVGVPAGSMDRPGCPRWGPGTLSTPHLPAGPEDTVPLLSWDHAACARSMLRILLLAFRKSLTCLVPSLDSWALGFHPPRPASEQILRVCGCLGESPHRL